MTILHSGTTKQYSSNWSQAFGAAPKAAAKSTAKKTAAKKGAAKKKTAKK